MSRWHAEIIPDESGQWHVRDLGSRNGTFVNGARVTDCILQNGDQLRFGDVAARFETESNEIVSLDDGVAAAPTSVTSLNASRPQAISPDHLRGVLDLGRMLIALPEKSDRLRALLELCVKPEMGGLWACALSVSAGDPGLRIQLLMQPAQSQWAKSTRLHISERTLQAVRESGSPVVATNVAQSLPFLAQMTVSPDAGVSSAIACPIAQTGETLDLIYITLPPDLGTIEWLMMVSLAVEQYRHADATWAARRAAETQAAMDHEHSLARQVQRSTLPPPRAIKCLDWAYRFDPCMAVAGDYVDVVVREDGSVLLVVADAVGKGMQAALIAAGLHAIFQTQGRTAQPLAQVLLAADRYLTTILEGMSFVTLAAIALDPLTGKGESVNCGHPPLLILDGRGNAHDLEGGNNRPLGLCNASIQSSTVQIQLGEWILGYTDGLSETRNEQRQMLGLKMLRDAYLSMCAPHAADSADHAAGQIMAFIDQFRGSAEVTDDRTLLVARRA
jgi:pSer/pThr/pTyr-binding forkhead associated (FHA) protein